MAYTDFLKPLGALNPLAVLGAIQPKPAGSEPLNPDALAIQQSQQGRTARQASYLGRSTPLPGQAPKTGIMSGGTIQPIQNALGGSGGLTGGAGALQPTQPITTPVNPATAQLQQEADNLAKYGSAIAPTRTAPAPTAEAPTPEPQVLEGEVVPPSPKFVDTYRNIYDSLGLGDIRSQIESSGIQLQELQDKKVDEISQINENPWLTEGQRQDRTNAINKKYEQKEANLINRIQLFQSTFEQGRQEAQFVASQTAQEQRFQTERLDSQMEAERKLKEAGQEILSLDDARALGLPYGTTVAEARKLGITPKAEQELGAGIVGEYQFYAQQEQAAGREPLSFSDYQTIDANRKARAVSGRGGGGSLPTSISGVSARTKAVYDNPGLLANYTPTERGKIIDELASAGVDISRFGLEKVAGGQREQIAKYDDLEREARNAEALVSQVNTGPLAGRAGSLAQVLGQASPEFTAYKSAISNMNSVLLNLRSGAAVSPSEYERIKGFIPLINEDEKTAAQKIPQFFAAINDAKTNYINRATQSSYQLQQSAQPSGGNTGTTSSGLGYSIVP